MVIRFLLLVVSSVLMMGVANAATSDDVTAPIRQFIDGFNSGDIKSAYAAYAPRSISIIDEFAPHLWVGPNAAHAWAAEYDRHAKATGVTDGVVKYSEPTRSEIVGDRAYVCMPTVYSYKEHGIPTVEEGEIAVVLRHVAAGWKMQAWTWSGVKPHPAK